jgi:hypothetical protein
LHGLPNEWPQGFVKALLYVKTMLREKNGLTSLLLRRDFGLIGFSKRALA